MISSRFGVTVSILISFALLPTIIHNYVGITDKDGLVTQKISTTLSGLSSMPTERRTSWVKEIYASEDWIERRYTAPTGHDIQLFVARSYDFKRLYHHPELGVLHGTDLKLSGKEKLPEIPGLSANLLRNRSGPGIAAYVFLYDGEFIDNPLLFQFRITFRTLISLKKPMTIFLVYEADFPQDAPFNKSLASKILTGSILSFNSQIPEKSQKNRKHL